MLVSETNIDSVERHLRELNPPVAIIDSIQTMFKSEVASAPGSVGQVRECAAQLMRLAKTTGISVFLVGHVTKEGMLAGPRVLEHMVDTVLYLEGDRHQFFRILRGVKNRFGSTNEIGIFEMRGSGLVEVANPSALFLIQRPQGDVPGSAVAAGLEGTRPLLVAIQALVSPAGYGVPRRMTTGVDHNRVALIAAVLEKRVGLNLGSHDIYVNAVGGVKLDEPAVDLAIACALASSFRDIPVDSGLVCAGEIGLTGELRPVTGAEKRVKEAFKLGFSRFLLSGQGVVSEKAASGILTADTVAEALELVLKV
jgi:DNA repair protein RadA/Sms